MVVNTTTPPTPYSRDDVTSKCSQHEKLADRVRALRDGLADVKDELKQVRKTLRWLMFVIGVVGAGTVGVPELVQALQSMGGG